MNYKEAMSYIHNTAKFGMNFGLQRTEKILEILGNPQENLKLIHIAGTNGKGSTSAMLSQILIESGYKTGMFTSPYIEEFEERIQINNVNIPKERLCEIISKLKIAIDEVIALGFDHPTEFEIITCAMFLYFFEEKIDIGVIEVGLGGRLDSTNVINPILTIITSISFDHMNILGNTLEEIAMEKAGILKNKVPLVLYPQEENSKQVILKIASSKDAKVTLVDRECGKFLKVIDNGQSVLQKIQIQTNKTYTLNLALLGKHQILNAAVVIRVVETLEDYNFKITEENIKIALEKVTWKGRLEIMRRNPLIVIDGAHNLGGIESLVDNVNIYFKYKNIKLILGILSDKEVYKMVEKITTIAEKVYTVTPNSERGELASELKNVVDCYNKNVESYADYSEALNNAIKDSSENDLILISGSLYMIGDMRKLIKALN
ncbi:MAG: folylpolyglutamate synthase/dihydrofolate synthase family protein [Clostridiaceae bacterium]